MGRSFLSIKLAAVFGLLVVATVTVAQRDAASDAAVNQVIAERTELGMRGTAVPSVLAESAVVVVRDAARRLCEGADSAHVDTVRAAVHIRTGSRTVRS